MFLKLAHAIMQEKQGVAASASTNIRIIGGLFPKYHIEKETLDTTDAWLDSHPAAAPALRRLVLECRDELARALRLQARDRAS
ncbi:hypothetical protein [Streptomyces sp. NPDC001139]